MTVFNILNDKKVNQVINGITTDKSKQDAIYDLLFIVYAMGSKDKPTYNEKIDIELVKQLDKIMPKNYVNSPEMKSIYSELENALIDYKKSETAYSKVLIMSKIQYILSVAYFDGMLNTLSIKGAPAEDVIMEQLKMLEK